MYMIIHVICDGCSYSNILIPGILDTLYSLGAKVICVHYCNNNTNKYWLLAIMIFIANLLHNYVFGYYKRISQFWQFGLKLRNITQRNDYLLLSLSLL